MSRGRISTLEEETEEDRTHLLSIQKEYFDQDQWYEALQECGLEHLTFRSEFVELSAEEALALLSDGHAEALERLVGKITVAHERLGCDRIFVKSARSPKDSQLVYASASQRLTMALRQKGADTSVWQLLAEARQQALGVGSGREAVALLRSSARICAPRGSEDSPEGGDIWWAVRHGLSSRLMVREFSGALPLAAEWRAFVWDGRCTAASQYFCNFGFEELQGTAAGRFATALSALMEQLEPLWSHLDGRGAMLDLAWTQVELLSLIEVNPFDPDRGLGHGASLCLFSWERDRKQICAGAELEVRVVPLRSVEEQVQETNRSWAAVGSRSRAALHAALESLSTEELRASHPVTREVARKLGLYRPWQVTTKGGSKGLPPAMHSGKQPAPAAGRGKGLAPTPSSRPLATVLAERRLACTEHSNTDACCTEIRPGLWLGNEEDTADTNVMRRNGITHVLNCAAELVAPQRGAGFAYLHIGLRDVSEAAAELANELENGSALDFIEEGVKTGGVLVHCRLGRSRSASIVVGYLMSRCGCSFVEAMEEVKSKRQLYGESLVEPNKGFQEVLRTFAGGG